MSEVADILNRAADLIEPEGAWTKGWTAKQADGAATWAEDPLAVCWCAGGAICRAGKNEAVRAKAMSALQTIVGGVVSSWNDAPDRTQAEVVAKLREAAARVESIPVRHIPIKSMESIGEDDHD